LVATIRSAFPDDSFFSDFDTTISVVQSKLNCYRFYEKTLSSLDAHNWSALKSKSVAQFSATRHGQTKESFFNTLNEAFALEILIDAGAERANFLKEGTSKTPDIAYVKDGRQLYCEVKTIGISDAEIQRRSGGFVYDGLPYAELNLGFFNKLDYDIRRATDQLRSVRGDGLVVVFVRFDDIACDYLSTYHSQLVKFCNERGTTNLIIESLHPTSRRKLF